MAIEEVLSAIRNYLDRLELDPSQLAALESRLDLIQNLKRKYGGDAEAVAAFGAAAAARLDKLSVRGETLARLDRELEAAQQVLSKEGKRLGKLRREAAARLGESVRERLAKLGFRQAGFAVAVETSPRPRPDGLDTVDFRFAPNPGEPEQALKAIASSGEISRVMLALKGALAEQDEVPLLVFDEIDANVGGEVAEAVGEMMRDLGRGHQVLCITHLPQVASKANAHFVVKKEVAGGRTRSLLESCSGDARVEEIARMLGGTGASAIAHARSLLDGGGGKQPAPGRRTRVGA